MNGKILFSVHHDTLIVVKELKSWCHPCCGGWCCCCCGGGCGDCCCIPACCCCCCCIVEAGLEDGITGRARKKWWISERLYLTIWVDEGITMVRWYVWISLELGPYMWMVDRHTMHELNREGGKTERGTGVMYHLRDIFDTIHANIDNVHVHQNNHESLPKNL